MYAYIYISLLFIPYVKNFFSIPFYIYNPICKIITPATTSKYIPFENSQTFIFAMESNATYLCLSLRLSKVVNAIIRIICFPSFYIFFIIWTCIETSSNHFTLLSASQLRNVLQTKITADTLSFDFAPLLDRQNYFPSFFGKSLMEVKWK